MQDLKSGENDALAISIKKVCRAYKCLFSELSPDYHKADFEVDKKSLVTALLNELKLPASLKEELISAIEIGWIPQSSPEELLGVDFEVAKDIINKFLNELETEIESGRDRHTLIFKYSLDLAGLNNNQLVGKYQRIDSVEALPEILSRVENYLLNGVDIGSSANSDSHSSRMNPKLPQLRSTTNQKDTMQTSSRDAEFYRINKSQSFKSNLTKEKLIAALEDGKTYKDCAEMFGCSWSTVAHHAKKFGLTKPQKPALTKETLEYNLIRMTPAQCAAKLGYDKPYIYTCMRRFGLKSGLRRSLKDLDHEILGAIKGSPSISLEDLSDQCDATKETISRSLNRLIDRGLIRFGYTTTADSDDSLIFSLKYKYSLKDIYSTVKSDPGISSDDLIIRLKETKDFVLKSLNRLISAKLVKFGYVFNDKSNNKPYISAPELCKEMLAFEEEDKVSQFLCQDDRNWIDEGDNLYSLGNFREAICCYDKAIEIDSQLSDGYCKKGMCLSALSNYEDSIKCFDMALKINPIFFDAFLNKGLALIKLGRYADSSLCFDKVIEINPRYALAWYYNGFVASILNQYERALYFYESAIEIDPSIEMAWKSRGNILYKKALYNDANKSYDMALEENPSYADAWYNKGLVLKKLGRYAEALSAYDNAININKSNHKCWNNKGIVFKKMGQYNNALDCYDKVIELGVIDINILNNIGNAFYGLGRYEDAIECYNNAIDLNPGSIIPLYNKAISMKKLNKINSAIELYEKITKINPEFIYAWINKGFAYKNLSMYSEAIVCFDKAISLKPLIGILWCYEGEVLNTMGNYIDANRCYSKAIELNPEMAEAWNGSGLALAGLGQYTDARKAFSKAKSLGYS